MVSTFWNIPGIRSDQSFQLFERSLNPLCVYDDRGRTLYASQSCLELLQANAEEISFFDYFSTNAAPQNTLAQCWERAMQGETTGFIATTKDRREEIKCSLQFSSDDKLMFLMAEKTTADQTVDSLLDAYGQAIAALVKTEEKWKTFVSNSAYLFIQLSNQGQILEASPAIESVLGYKATEVLGRHISELIHPRHLKEFEQVWQGWNSGTQARQSGIECWWRTKSGQWISLALEGQRFPVATGIDGVVISGYDISDRKEIEAALLATEEKYRSLVLNVPGAVFRCDSIYTLAYVSDAIEDITGYPASDLVNNQVQSYLGMIHPDDIDRIKDSLVQTVLDQHRSSIEYRIIHADGQIRWVSEHKQGVFAPDGSLLWLDGILLDISDRKRAEVTLGRYEAQNRSMTQLLPDWIRFNGLDPIPNYILNPNTPIPD